MQVSGSSTTPELSDKRAYPTFMRTIASDEQQFTILAGVMKARAAATRAGVAQRWLTPPSLRVQHYGWHFFAVIHTSDSYGEGGARVLQRAALRDDMLDLVITESMPVSIASEASAAPRGGDLRTAARAQSRRPRHGLGSDHRDADGDGHCAERPPDWRAHHRPVDDQHRRQVAPVA